MERRGFRPLVKWSCYKSNPIGNSPYSISLLHSNLNFVGFFIAKKKKILVHRYLSDWVDIEYLCQTTLGISHYLRVKLECTPLHLAQNEFHPFRKGLLDLSGYTDFEQQSAKLVSFGSWRTKNSGS